MYSVNLWRQTDNFPVLVATSSRGFQGLHTPSPENTSVGVVMRYSKRSRSSQTSAQVRLSDRPSGPLDFIYALNSTSIEEKYNIFVLEIN